MSLQQPVMADKISRFQVSFLLYFLMCYGQCKWKPTCVLGELDVSTGPCPVQQGTAFELLPAWLHLIRNSHQNWLILKIKSTNFLLTKTVASTMLEALAIRELWLMLYSEEVCLPSSKENQGVRGYSASCTPRNFSAMPSRTFAALLLVFGGCHLWC